MVGKYVKIYNKYLYSLKSSWVSHIIIIIIYLCEALALYYCYIETDVTNFKLKFIVSNIITMLFAGFCIIGIIIIYLLIKLIFHKNFKISNQFILKNKYYHYIWLIGIYCAIIVSILTSIYVIDMLKEGITWLADTYVKQ